MPSRSAGTLILSLLLGSAFAIRAQAESAVSDQACEALKQSAYGAAANDSDAQLQLGIHLFRCGRPVDALEPLRKALQLNPDSSSAYFYLGAALLAIDRESEAKTAFSHMAAKAPAGDDEIYVLARSYSMLSAALLERLHALSLDSYRLNQVQGQFLEARNRLDEAVREYSEMVRKRSDSATAHYHLGSALWTANRAPEAIEEFRMVIARDPLHYMARYKLASILASEGNRNEAVRQFRAVLDLQPGFADAHLGLAKTLEQAGSTNEALQETEVALKNDPSSAEIHFLKQRILRKIGRISEADEELATFRRLRGLATSLKTSKKP